MTKARVVQSKNFDVKHSVCFLMLGSYPFFAESKNQTGGAEYQIYLLAKHLRKVSDYRTSVIVGDYGQPVHEKRMGVDLYRYATVSNSESFLTRVMRVFQLISVLRRAKSDVYVTTTTHALAGIVALYCRLTGARHVHRVAHDFECDLSYYNGKSRLMRRLFRFALHNADAITTQHSDQQASLLKHQGLGSSILPNSVELYKENRQEVKGGVLWVGRTATWKNPHAFMDLAEALPDETFTMICPITDGTSQFAKEVQARAASLPNLHYVRFVPHAEIQKYFDRASVFVNTSDMEGFPNTFIQAGMGLTPIVSLHVNPGDVLTREGIGMDCNGDAGKLQEYVVRFLDDASYSAKIGRQGREYVQRQHDAQKNAVIFSTVVDAALHSAQTHDTAERVLVIAPRFHTNLNARVKAMQENGANVRVAVLYRGKSETYQAVKPTVVGYSLLYRFVRGLRRKNNKTHLQSFWELKLSLPSLRKLWKMFREHSPDIVVFKGSQSLLEWVVLFFSRAMGVPVVEFIQVRKHVLLGSKMVFRLYYRFVQMLGVRAFVSPTREGVEHLTTANVNRVEYSPFAIEVPSQNPRRISRRISGGQENEVRKIMMVGKFVPRKEHALLVEAVATLHKDIPVTLTMFGEPADQDYEKHVRKLIQKNGLNDIVTIREHLSHSAMLEEYAKHDVFVLPSFTEPAAYSIVEALSHGLPVVCSDDCGTRSYVQAGINGEVFHARSHESLVRSIRAIIQDPHKLQNMSESSYTLSVQNHDYRVAAAKFQKLFSWVLC